MFIEKKLSQLKKISELTPDKKWEATAKYEIIAEISSQNRLMKALALTTLEKIELVLTKILRRSVPSAAKVVAGFLIVVMGSGLGFVAQASVPGETLWPIKRSIEKAELTLTVSPVKETEVHIKHVGERINEINKILKDENKQTVSKTEKAIKQAVSHLEKDVKAVDSTLKVVKEEKKPSETINLAKKVQEATQVTQDQVKSLQSTSPDNGSGVITDALKAAEEATEETEKSVLNLAVEVHQEIVGNTSIGTSGEQLVTDRSTSTEDTIQISDEEVATVKQVVNEILTTEINKLNSEIEQTKDKVSQATVIPTSTQELTSIESSDNDQLVVAQDGLDEAANELTEAKSLLESGDIKQVLDKVVKSKDLSDTITATVDKLTSSKLDATIIPTDLATPTPTSTDSNLINMQTITSTDEFIGDNLLEASATPVKEETADEVKN